MLRWNDCRWEKKTSQENFHTKERFKHLHFAFALPFVSASNSKSNSSHLHAIESFSALSFNCVVILINNFSFAESFAPGLCRCVFFLPLLRVREKWKLHFICIKFIESSFPSPLSWNWIICFFIFSILWRKIYAHLIVSMLMIQRYEDGFFGVEIAEWRVNSEVMFNYRKL